VQLRIKHNPGPVVHLYAQETESPVVCPRFGVLQELTTQERLFWGRLSVGSYVIHKDHTAAYSIFSVRGETLGRPTEC